MKSKSKKIIKSNLNSLNIVVPLGINHSKSFVDSYMLLNILNLARLGIFMEYLFSTNVLLKNQRDSETRGQLTLDER